jgi:hypothetical protein
MIKGTRPPEKILAMAKKLKVPVTQLEWGKGSRQYLTTSFIKSMLKRKLHNKKFGKPKYKPLPLYPNWDWDVAKKKWSQKYKNSINCKHPKGFSQKQHCKLKRSISKKV